MSLILDALKKSEAERRRGLPPTLHVQFGSAPRRARRAPWVAGAGAVLLAAGLAGGWMWMARERTGGGLDAPGATPLAGSTATPAVASPVAAAESLPEGTLAAAQAPGSAPGSTPAFATHASESAFGSVAGGGNGGSVSGGGLPVPERAMLYTPSVNPAPAFANAPPPAAAPLPPPAAAEAAQPGTIAAAAPAVATASAPATAELVPPPAAAVELAAASAPPSLAEAVAHAESPLTAPETADWKKPEEALPAIHELPYATRKDLPKLALSMHVYSPEPGESFVVLNGKRYGADTPPPGPELELLSIVADGVVLEYRGQRFLLPRQTF